ncbi:MAG: heparinase II/III family protein, partial [Verrucomicrobia bacterium]|nr:heparinase II/III family protein [Verrucomicrobiota bacterium]
MKALHYLQKAISLPPHIVAVKAFRKLRGFWTLKARRWRDAQFSTYAAQSVGKLRQFLQPVDPSLLPREAILSGCASLFRHEFDLLGSGPVRVCRGVQYSLNLSNQKESMRIAALLSPHYAPIDWHIDFKSGYRWREDTWSPKIQYGTHPGADVKVPWELSRMQHLSLLAWGYALERDAKYITEFQNQILDFIAANPPRYGVNWVCTMDVGIRIANWLFAYDLFRAYQAPFDPSFEEVFVRSVLEHGQHIMTHLEWDPYLRSNHYLANIAGLLFAAVYLHHEEWLSFAMRELKAEALIQFHPDGSNFEASTSYHRLSTEMVVYSLALALESGLQPAVERLQKMGDFIRDITKPDGTIVQFGDNDSGRFLKIFPDLDERNHQYLIRSIRNCHGLNSVIRAQLERHTETSVPFAHYTDFGLSIHRRGPWYLAMRCGSIGQKGNGGHAHHDQLSFELAVRGVSMIIDPGTYVYTPWPEERRRFRSTSMHNTLCISGNEQHLDVGLFQLKDRGSARIVLCEPTRFIGEHSGFGATHRREVTLHNESIEGFDHCSVCPHQISFHFAPGWQGRQIAPNVTE